MAPTVGPVYLSAIEAILHEDGEGNEHKENIRAHLIRQVSDFGNRMVSLKDFEWDTLGTDEDES